jgi:hypothetical protein
VSTIFGNSIIAGAAGVLTANVTNAVASGSITLRAATDLTVSSSVKTGYVSSVVGNAVSGSIRLQAGNELSTATGGTVVLGNAETDVGGNDVSQIGSLGLQATQIFGAAAANPFEIRVGLAWGAATGSNKGATIGAKETAGTAQLVNRTTGKFTVGTVSADSPIFTPAVTGGANVTVA